MAERNFHPETKTAFALLLFAGLIGKVVMGLLCRGICEVFPEKRKGNRMQQRTRPENERPPFPFEVQRRFLSLPLSDQYRLTQGEEDAFSSLITSFLASSGRSFFYYSVAFQPLSVRLFYVLG